MKKLLCIVAFVGLFSTQAAAQTASLPDVSENHLYADGIGYVVQNKIIPTYRNGTFHPQRPMARLVFLMAAINANFDRVSSQIRSKCAVAEGVHPRDTKSPALKRARYLCIAENENIIDQSKSFFGRSREETILLPEAAKIIMRAFRGESNEQSYDNEPYRNELMFLEKFHAILPTFFLDEDKLTRGEAAEMIYRVKEGMAGKSLDDKLSTTYDSLLKRGPWKNATFFYDTMEEFLRLADVSGYELPASLLDAAHIQKLMNLASYRIINVSEEGPSAWGLPHYYEPFYVNDCGTFNAAQVELTYSEARTKGIPRDFSATFFNPFDEQCSGYTEPEAGQAGGPIRANREYQFSFSLRDGKLMRTGGAGERMRVYRETLGKAALSYDAENRITAWYDYAKVDTQGSVEMRQLPGGKTVYVYRTAWKPIFNGHMQGASYFATAKTLSDGRHWKKFFVFAPGHNMSTWNPNVSYEKCLEFPEFEAGGMPAGSYDFCFKRDGNDLLVASPWELGDTFTLWIDEKWRKWVQGG